MARQFKIVRVDPTSDAIARSQINEMHLALFPGLKVVETHIGYWWIVRGAKDKPVGFCGLWHSVQRPKDTGYLARAGVLDDARGYGLQRRMIRVREAKCRSLGLMRAVTDTDYANIYSANNVLRCGYELFRPSIEWAGTSAPWLYWQRILSSGVA